MKKATGNSVMTQVPNTVIATSGNQSPTRLDSWKDIAAYLNRSVRTVQRWEELESMPVHRHIHATGGSLFAYRHELDAWRTGRSQHGRERPTPPVTELAQVRSQQLDQQSRLCKLLEGILQQLGEELASPRVSTAQDETFGQCTSEKRVAALADLRTAGDNIDGDGNQPRPFLPQVQ